MNESYIRTADRVEFTLLGVINKHQDVKFFDVNLPYVSEGDTPKPGRSYMDMSDSVLSALAYVKKGYRVIKVRVSYIVGNPKRTICRVFQVGKSRKAPMEVWTHGFPAYRNDESGELCKLTAHSVLAEQLRRHGIVVSREDAGMLLNPFEDKNALNTRLSDVMPQSLKEAFNGVKQPGDGNKQDDSNKQNSGVIKSSDTTTDEKSPSPQVDEKDATDEQAGDDKDNPATVGEKTDDVSDETRLTIMRLANEAQRKNQA